MKQQFEATVFYVVYKGKTGYYIGTSQSRDRVSVETYKTFEDATIALNLGKFKRIKK
jgi:hypothetical protein